VNAAIDQSTQDFIIKGLKTAEPDVIAKTLVQIGHASSLDQATQTGAQVIAAQQPVVVAAQPEQLEGIIDLDPEPTTVETTPTISGPAASIPQPDAKGEFASPLDGALWMAMTWGIPQTPLRGKAPFLPEWQKRASADPEQIRKWAAEYPGTNFGSVALPGGVFIFEVDASTVLDRFSNFTSQLIIQSGKGRGHRYYKQVPGLENISQDNLHGDFSLRVDAEQCVSPGSVHPERKTQYKVKVGTGLVEATPAEIAFWNSEKKQKAPVTARLDGPRVARGNHDIECARIAGKLRNAGMNEEGITNALILIIEERFDDFGPDYREMAAKVSHSICKHPIGPDTRVLHNGVPVGPIPQNGQQVATAEPVEIPEFTKVPYPVFPRWIMEQPGESGKAPSIYTGLVKPWCDVNSRYPEFMFLPAMALLLNYLNGKMRIEYNDTPFSIFMMLIGKQGRVIKSSSVESAVRYLADAGVCDYATSVEKADLRTLVWTAGSTEGLGMGMRDKSCINSVLFYDELKTAASKAKIDAASLGSVLLTLYESGLFQNQIKSSKSSFSFTPKSYVTSFIACNTDEDFAENWASLATGKKGMDERFFFLLQPEHLDPLKPKHDVDCKFAALETKKLIDKAVLQEKFSFTDKARWDAQIETFGNRAALRAEKWALAFAVDMGLDTIDEDCIERAYALTQYELDVKRYLGAREAETKEAMIQNRVRETLERQPNGQMPLLKLNAVIKPERFGTSLWNQAFKGLQMAGIIRLGGTGTRSDPIVVQLLQKFSGEV
jgi:bifunctional DNA primase/polymerase-like protein